jgi:hypothetical protein
MSSNLGMGLKTVLYANTVVFGIVYMDMLPLRRIDFE